MIQEKQAPKLPDKVFRAFEQIDAMSPEMRSCVHDLGWEPVSVMARLGLKPNQIRSIVYACWSAPTSPHQLPGMFAPIEGRESSVLRHLDTLLSRSGSSLSGRMLLAALRSWGMIVVPFPASQPMVRISMETIADHNQKITKEHKHSARLNAALEAGAKRLWPNLFRRDA